MNKWLGLALILLIVICLGLGFFFINRKEPGTTYEGVLPGADCAGLKTELTLYQDGTYFLKETYLATRDGDKTFTSAGKWQTVKFGKYEIIQLNYNKPQEIYNFRQKDADHLVVVDKELKMIDCPMNLTLSRKK
ncbi:MAG: copper resistance protein NlpE [Candidatus Margulisiibacteriota bacterium]